MGIYRKALRYGLKKRAEASQGSLARTADRLKILSSVLAAGFVVLPFFYFIQYLLLPFLSIIRQIYYISKSPG